MHYMNPTQIAIELLAGVVMIADTDPQSSSQALGRGISNLLPSPTGRTPTERTPGARAAKTRRGNRNISGFNGRTSGRHCAAPATLSQ